MSAAVPDFRKMTPEQVQEYLEKRRRELTVTVQAAKAAGVKVSEAKKGPTDDKDKLEWLFERLGYQTGMRWWAQGRMDELTSRIESVLKVMELDGEAVGVLLKEAAEGYRKARIGTSFESTSMPDKKSADAVPTSEVFQELLGKWRRTYGPSPEFLTQLIEGVEVPEAPPPPPSDREMFPRSAAGTQEGEDPNQEPTEVSTSDSEPVDRGASEGGEPAGGGDGEAGVAAGPEPLLDGAGELREDGTSTGGNPPGESRGGRQRAGKAG